MKKKMLSMVMCLLLLAGLMSGCSSDSGESGSSGKSEKKRSGCGGRRHGLDRKSGGSDGCYSDKLPGAKRDCRCCP